MIIITHFLHTDPTKCDSRYRTKWHPYSTKAKRFTRARTKVCIMIRNTNSEFRVPASYMRECGLSGTPESANGAQCVRRITTSVFRAPDGHRRRCGIPIQGR